MNLIKIFEKDSLLRKLDLKTIYSSFEQNRKLDRGFLGSLSLIVGRIEIISIEVNSTNDQSLIDDFLQYCKAEISRLLKPTSHNNFSSILFRKTSTIEVGHSPFEEKGISYEPISY